MEGQTIGSRVLVAAPAEDAFGEAGNPALGIANQDTVIIVIDLVSGVLDGPQGTDKDAPDWTPEIVEKDGVPTSLDFKGTPEPADRLRIAPLVQGDGAKVEKGQTIVVDYLGQVYGGEAPFDSSYSRGEPTSFQIGTGASSRAGTRPWSAGPSAAGCCCRSRPSSATARKATRTPASRAPTRSTSWSTSWPRAEGSSRLGAMAIPWRPQAATSRKSERLLNLLIMLLVQRHYVSKERIRAILYPDSRPDAFEKMFERDKEELRSLGVPIEVGSIDPLSTTSPATASRPTSSPCPTSAWPPTRRRWSAWPPASGSTPGWPRPPPTPSAS